MTQYCVGANYTWLLVEGVYLHRLLSLAAFPEQGCFALYLATGWGEWASAGIREAGQRGSRPQLLPLTGAPLLFVIPWVVVKCLFENIQ